MSNDQPTELTSWKEIADRLQVTVRTAQEWEKKRGLPVKRIPGEGRSRVFIRVDELEAWLNGQLGELDEGSAAGASGGGAGTSPGRRSWLPAAGVAAIILSAIAAVVYFLLQPPPVPVEYRVLPDELVILDEAGEEMWRASFEGGLNTASYESRDHSVTFDDVDGDGRKDTLFVFRARGRGRSQALICFDENGQEMWRFVPGKDVSTADEVFPNVYNIGEFRPLELPDGSRAIVITGHHYLMYPTQVVVLGAAEGTLRSEYWHAGHVGTEPHLLAVADANDDGSPEIYLAGINNAHRRATLVVLDPLTMAGAATEPNPDYQLNEFASPSELVRILFRRSAVSLLKDEHNIADSLWITPEYIVVSVAEGFRDAPAPGVIYSFRPDFMLDQHTFNSGFPLIYEQLLEEGAVEMDIDEQKRLLGVVDYVGGSAIPAEALPEGR